MKICQPNRNFYCIKNDNKRFLHAFYFLKKPVLNNMKITCLLTVFVTAEMCFFRLLKFIYSLPLRVHDCYITIDHSCMSVLQQVIDNIYSFFNLFYAFLAQVAVNFVNCFGALKTFF